jgi:hypothetical protein
MDAGLFHHLRVISAAEVTRRAPSAAYSIRQIFRWYSKTFHTPLHVVQDIPLYDVVQAYYESHYESMEDEALQEEVHKLILSEEEKFQQALQEDAEEYSLAQLERELAEEAKQQAPQTIESIAESKKQEVPVEMPEIKMSFLDLGEGADLLDKDPLDFSYENSSKTTA